MLSPEIYGKTVDIDSDGVFDPSKTSVDIIIVADSYLIPPAKVLDVGTGSGYLGIFLKKLNPKVRVEGVDIDPNAIKVAKRNAHKNKTWVKFSTGNLAEDKKGFDMVVANLPTYTPEDMRRYERHGPDIAYYAGDDGLSLYKELFQQLPEVLKKEGIFVCECRKDYKQSLKEYAELQGWEPIMEVDNALAFAKKQL